MKVIKKTDEYTIFQKRNSRYAVRGEGRKMINGEDKEKILLAEGLIKAPEPKKVEEAPAEEPAAEAAGEEEAEG